MTNTEQQSHVEASEQLKELHKAASDLDEAVELAAWRLDDPEDEWNRWEELQEERKARLAKRIEKQRKELAKLRMAYRLAVIQVRRAEEATPIA